MPMKHITRRYTALTAALVIGSAITSPAYAGNKYDRPPAPTAPPARHDALTVVRTTVHRVSFANWAIARTRSRPRRTSPVHLDVVPPFYSALVRCHGALQDL